MFPHLQWREMHLLERNQGVRIIKKETQRQWKRKRQREGGAKRNRERLGERKKHKLIDSIYKF